MPVDQQLLIVAREGSAIAFEIDGETVAPPPAASGRWEATVPSERNAPLLAKEAPLPFEAEVGPLLKGGQINQLEADWLRLALGGEKGDRERALVARLFASPPALTVMQWRAQTALEFKPTREALTSTDPALRARALDLVLLPGQATMRLLRIEPGTYQKGAPADEHGRLARDPLPAPTKVAKAFFIGVHEVTNQQYRSVTNVRPPSYFEMTAGKSNPEFPVEQVRWRDLQAFISQVTAALSKLTGGTLVADLPSDDEWEYACRAGTSTAFGNGRDLDAAKPNSWLNELVHFGNEKSLRAVGQLLPNAWGLRDMHGNVQEWTSDNTLRGGSWKSSAGDCRSASRKNGDQNSKGDNETGFRLVLRLRNPAPTR